MNKILNVPNDQYDYEFMVAIQNSDGDFEWHSNHETAEAYDVAKEIGGVVIHNVRISHKKLKKILTNIQLSIIIII